MLNTNSQIQILKGNNYVKPAYTTYAKPAYNYYSPKSYRTSPIYKPSSYSYQYQFQTHPKPVYRTYDTGYKYNTGYKYKVIMGLHFVSSISKTL